MPTAYLGSDPYIFVSYAHRDREKVFPFIAALQKSYNVWFDDGIHFGKEWEEEIGAKLLGCAVFIFMVSDRSLQSDNCKDELHFARENSKPFVNVLLEDLPEMPVWFRLRYMRYQDCRLYTYSSPDGAVSDLARKCPELEKAKAAPVKPAQAAAAQHAAPSTTSAPSTPSTTSVPAAPSAPPPAPEDPLFIIKRDGSRTVLVGVKDKTVDEVTIPDGVTEIGARAFEGCTKLEAVWISDSVTKIDENAFRNCSILEYISFGKNIAVIGDNAFSGCVGILEADFTGVEEDPCEEVDIGQGNDRLIRWNPFEFAWENGKLVLKKAFFGQYDQGQLRFNDHGVTLDEGPSIITSSWAPRLSAIAPEAFRGSKAIQGVFILTGSNLSAIGDRAFQDCTELTVVVVSDHVTDFGAYAFSGCTSLREVFVCTSKIPEGAFENCPNLECVTLSSSLTEIGKNAFHGCDKLRLVSFPGLKKDWKAVRIEKGNEKLTSPFSGVKISTMS